MKYNRFSRKITVFHGREVPETGLIAGYGSIIDALDLPLPLPHTLCLISSKKRQYEEEGWLVFTPRHQPEDNLYKQLIFAIKYEGINLLVLNRLFAKLTKDEVLDLIRIEPSGQYSRKIWFLYEWLTQDQLDLPNLSAGNYVPLLDDDIQFTIEGVRSPRHRILNNLPGTRTFCPLIYKSAKLKAMTSSNLSDQKQTYLSSIHKDVLRRASAFLLLKDSKASFAIEGEEPGGARASRWGRAIGQAGLKPLSKNEILRLQQIIIASDRFMNMGFREQGGFVGEHDRTTGEPIPDHICARWKDLEKLIDGLMETSKLLEDPGFDAVLAAAVISFGFVFIHPLEDGNGRLHRYLIHHVLSKKQLAEQGIIFPVSASILNHIDDYRQTLESYSEPLLDFIKWTITPENNIEVLNETMDLYSFFDATRQAEFLYDCVEDTLRNIIPEEVSYLQKYDEMKSYLDDHFEMPDKNVALLLRFLEQNNGLFSQRTRINEFSQLDDDEVADIEKKYKSIFAFIPDAM
ncbi:MAG: Fic family protein [Leptospirales bacterium]